MGLAENTVLIFTSDNGGEDRVTSNAPLRAGKSTLYEGGIREALIVRWAGLIEAGSVCTAATSTVDFYPTLLAIAGHKPEKNHILDGVSLLPLLKGKKTKLKRDVLYWHYPLAKPHFLGGRSGGAIRVGDFKLIEFFDDRIELYNLADDISEKNNLAEKMPAKAAQLQKRLAKWRKEVGAKGV